MIAPCIKSKYVFMNKAFVDDLDFGLRIRINFKTVGHYLSKDLLLYMDSIFYGRRILKFRTN